MKRLTKMKWQSLKNRKEENQKILGIIPEEYSSHIAQGNRILMGTTVIRIMNESLSTMVAPPFA